MAITFVFAELIERRPRNDRLVYGFTALELVLFGLFYPVLTGVEASTEFCLSFLKWLPGWPWG